MCVCAGVGGVGRGGNNNEFVRVFLMSWEMRVVLSCMNINNSGCLQQILLL